MRQLPMLHNHYWFFARLLLQVVLLCWLSCATGTTPHDSTRPIIDLSRLAVTTALDFSNAEVMRDALTLFRSIRAFGGELNKATIVGCVITDTVTVPGIDYVTKLIDELAVLRVELSFAAMADQTAPKTLNKFLALSQLDLLRFDYVLWMDADTVVFDDPTLHLRAHEHPGYIECVPELYSYLRRYPSMNTTGILWDALSSRYHLPSENEISPLGTCNTGVLFFDRLSLSRLTGGLAAAAAELANHKLPYRDRFVDSLLFVITITQQHIDVRTLPYEMNFMAFFEFEFEEDIKLNQAVLIGHFIAETSLYCEENSDGTCACVYANEHKTAQSPITRALKRVLDRPLACQQLSRTSSIFPSYVVNTFPPLLDMPTQFQPAYGRSLECKLDWPLADSVVHWYSLEDTVQLLLSINCNYHKKNKDILFEVLREVIWWLQIPDGQPVSPKTTAVMAPIVYDEPDADFDYETSAVHSYLELSIDPESKPLVKSTILANFDRVKYLNTSLVVELLNADHTVHLKVQIPLRFIIESFVPTSEIMLSVNALRSQTRTSLRSQLLLPSFLHARRLTKTVVFVCCDTIQGLTVLRHTIEQWNGGMILIVMNSLPSNDLLETSAVVVLEGLSSLCSHRKAGGTCIISNHIDDGNKANALDISLAMAHGMLPRNSVDAVYLDYYESFTQYTFLVTKWLAMLTRGGVIMGSRFLEEHEESGHGGRGLTHMSIASAVNAVSADRLLTVFITYREHSEEFCRLPSFEKTRGIQCSPAWYFINI